MFIIIGIEVLLYMLEIILCVIIGAFSIDMSLKEYEEKKYFWVILWLVLGIFYIIKTYNILIEIFM